MIQAVIEMGIIVGALVVFIVGAAATWHYMTAPVVGNYKEPASRDEFLRTSARSIVAAVVLILLWIFGLVWTCAKTTGLGGTPTGRGWGDSWGDWYTPTTGVAPTMILILMPGLPLVLAGVTFCLCTAFPNGGANESIRARIAAGQSAAMWPGVLTIWALVFTSAYFAKLPVRIGKALGHSVVRTDDRELMAVRTTAAIAQRVDEAETNLRLIDADSED